MKALRFALLAAPLLAGTSLARAPSAAAAPTPTAPTGGTAAKPAHGADSHGTAEHKGDCHHPPVAADAKAGDGWKLTRGAPLQGAATVKLKELLATPAKYEGKTVQVEGQVRKACEKKGCWMELAGDPKSPGVRVTFKDYGFFVPLDAAGSKARVEGKVTVALLSEERAKHYEGEGAIVPRGKDGKPREVQLVATGVELQR